ncbi:MAG: type II toxin-antitoxin system VapC family toxin [Elainella sp. C42_A2020_010]|nr:type II toxin-antitoxin system VapC family toxin [Elainella sp. C42_A2020_010]
MVDAYFLDSSALLKRYVPEVGTAWIQSITDAQNQNLLIVAHIAWVEISSAVARRQREGNISSIQANQILSAFRAHWNTQYFIVTIDHTVIDLAGQLVNQHPLRAYDAVQLAAALSLQGQLSLPNVASFTFLTADTRLLAIAQAESLLADDPNLHL